VGKNKLARWTELESFNNVIQPPIEEVVSSGKESDRLTPETAKDHPIKGRWNETIFRNQNPVVLELGCGRGEYTIGLAARFQEKNYIGVDIKGARLWRGAKTSNEKNIANAAFLRTRIEFISSFFAEDEVEEIWITFPDPHPGTRNSNKGSHRPGT
jgi:tRNA (guanine-N7-)-methyltransferase